VNDAHANPGANAVDDIIDETEKAPTFFRNALTVVIFALNKPVNFKLSANGQHPHCA
jgi:hypothetical protein